MRKIMLGDCLEKLRELEPNSIDAIVTDPPYGLSFMGKKWDYDVPSVEIWRECLRVLKPGGHLLSFAGTRTYHRMACNIEDAGFEIRDQIMWLYGSGFPKSQNVSIQIDKQAGAMGHRGKAIPVAGRGARVDIQTGSGWNETNTVAHQPITDQAKQWQGWGTALKPANEPIVVARKPLEKGLTVAENVLKYGTGALNIDASRLESPGRKTGTKSDGEEINAEPTSFAGSNKRSLQAAYDLKSLGRWPANVLLDEEAAAALDEQTGDLGKSSGGGLKNADKYGGGYAAVGEKTIGFGDSGGASRFFYVAKASKAERNKGLEGMPLKKSGVKNDSGRGFSEGNPYKEVLNQNHHPTVKPIKLMEYLIKLVTPPNGVVLDPFMGSGTTGVAAKRLVCQFIGIEREAEYKVIAEKRIEAAL